MIQAKHKGKGGSKGGKARNVLMGYKQWNDYQVKVLLKYVIANCGSGQHAGINWTNWDSDGVEGFKKAQGQSKLQTLIIQYKRMNEGDDTKTNDAITKQLYQSLLTEQLALESRTVTAMETVAATEAAHPKFENIATNIATDGNTQMT